MLHKQVEARVTPTERGTFVALASTYGTDRGGDRVQPGAFAETIRRWQASGKMIPLHWDHNGDPKDIVGTVDPASLKETSEGLRVEAQLDLDESTRAREIWRLVKANSVGLSFGYLVTSEHERGGIRELHTIDLFEISLTPAPMNPDAKVLSWKAAATHDESRLPSHAELRERVKQLDAEQKAREPATKSTAPITVATFDC